MAEQTDKGGVTEPTDTRDLSREDIEARKRWYEAKLSQRVAPLSEEVTYWRSEVALCDMALRTAEAERERDRWHSAFAQLSSEYDELVEEKAAAESALRELDRAALRMAQVINKSADTRDRGGVTVKEWDEARQEVDRARKAARAVLAGKPSEAKDAALSIDDLISVWSMRPQPGTPTGDAWEAGARQGWQWRDAALKGSHD